MSDRELLELAAKALGCDFWHNAETFSDWISHPACAPIKWNPLTDDGDALRLAVDLGIRMDFAKDWTVAYSGSCASEQFSERHEDGAYAATRRAIVRAAAEIGRAMP